MHLCQYIFMPENQNQRKYTISEDEVGERLDKFLAFEYPELSRSRFQTLISEGSVSVNNQVEKSNYRLKEEDVILVEIPEAKPLAVLPENIPLDILYEDYDLLVVNKPKGMVVHPANGHWDHTLVNALLYHCKDLSGINGVLRPGIVHRIDRDTTGSLIVCKNDYSHQAIAAQIAEHSVHRIYEGIVCGVLKEDQGTIHLPIGRDEKDRKKMSVTSHNSKDAITHYEVLKRFQDYTYVRFRLETGRTHQIRVHMAHLGYPLLGDEVYGHKKCPYKLQGQTLHAKTIGFIHPTSGEYIEVNAPLPEYFEHLLDILK